MFMDPSLYIGLLGLMFLIGIVISLVSNKLKVPNVLFLIIVGILISNYPLLRDKPLFSIDFIATIGILSLILIVFDSTSRFKLREFDTLSISALKLTAIFSLFALIILGFCVKIMLNIPLYLALAFAGVLIGTDPTTILPLVKTKQNKTLKLLGIESIINTPLTVLLPFIFIDYVSFINTEINTMTISLFFSNFFIRFFKEVVAGVGAGFLVGLIMFKLMKNKYSKIFSPIGLITAAILAYSLAKLVEGNGVFSVTTLGLFFGNVYMKNKQELQEYSSLLSQILEILVFILVGFIIKLNSFNMTFFIYLILIFLLYLIIRFISVFIVFNKSNLSNKEKLFLSLVFPKGIATAVTIIAISLKLVNHSLIIDLLVGFLLLSVLFSTIIVKFENYFLQDYSKIKPD